MDDLFLSLMFLRNLPSARGVVMFSLLLLLLPVPRRGSVVLRRLLGERHVTLLDAVWYGSVCWDLLNVHTWCVFPVSRWLKVSDVRFKKRGRTEVTSLLEVSGVGGILFSALARERRRSSLTGVRLARCSASSRQLASYPSLIHQ